MIISGKKTNAFASNSCNRNQAGAAGDPIFNSFCKSGSRFFEYALNGTNQSKLTAILLGDKCPRGHRFHQQRHMPSGKKNNKNETSKLVKLFIKPDGKSDNGLDDRFG